RGARQAFYANAAAVYYAGGEFLVEHETQIVPTLIVGYEYALTAYTNLNIQGYASTSVYSRRDTELDELLGNKYQLTAGFRHRRASSPAGSRARPCRDAIGATSASLPDTAARSRTTCRPCA